MASAQDGTPKGGAAPPGPSCDEPDPSAWYRDLTGWIGRGGGAIHPSLEAFNSSSSRGVRASEAIAQGELLIRLPAGLALDGSNLPVTYPAPEEDAAAPRTASPWLRCLARLLTEEGSELRDGDADGRLTDFGPYLRSLPRTYDTLLDKAAWPENAVNRLLGGTTLGRMVSEDRRRGVLRQRYGLGVRPYLGHVGVPGEGDKDEGEGEGGGFEAFRRACACISTRGFHLEPDASSRQEEGATYSGPFLLPYIDLLNHSTSSPCTTLRRDPADGAFTMIAERSLLQGEEVCHAYGTDLTSAQLLQTFGFVEEGTALRASEGSWDGVNSGTVTPATFSAGEVLKACQSVLGSTYPSELRALMARTGVPDEAWDLPPAHGGRDVLSSGLIPDDVMVAPDVPLSEELLTLLCLPFLPDDVYAEWKADPCLWTEEVLGDYFLGKLALRSLVLAIGSKMEGYPPLRPLECGLGDGGQSGEGDRDWDNRLLARLLNAPHAEEGGGQLRKRAIYALAVRLEEKRCLNMLKKKLVDLAEELDEESAGEEKEAGGGDHPTKKIRL